LAEIYAQGGQVEEGLAVLDEAIEAVENTGEHLYEAELCRLKETILLQHSVYDIAQVEWYFQKSLTVSHNQQAKSWELRASTSLAKLWQSQGKRQEAFDLLASVYGWFTEGFDTADLIDAKTLLDELA
jgi:predicted ATPase